MRFADSTHPTRSLQLLTIAELLSGRRIDMPAWRELRTFKKAPKARAQAKGQGQLRLGEKE